jgi:hypothetical protein
MLKGLWRISKGKPLEKEYGSLREKLAGRRHLRLDFMYGARAIKVLQLLGKNADHRGIVDSDDRQDMWYRLHKWQALGGITYLPREQWDPAEGADLIFEGSICPEWFLTADVRAIYGHIKIQNPDSSEQWHLRNLKKLHDLHRSVSILLVDAQQ